MVSPRGALALLAAAAQAVSAVSLNFTNCCGSVEEATAFAIAYGTPLASYEIFLKPFLNISGANALYPERTLSGPEDVNVVSENTDTLYMFAAIDLSETDLVITIPKITDGRYYSYPFYDPYGDLFALVSSVNGFPTGDYLIRRADDVGVQPGLQLQFASQDYVPKYTGIINFPTTYGFMVNRILVLHNTTEDVSTVNGYQDATKLVTTPRTITNAYLPKSPALTPELVNTDNITDMSMKSLELLARLGQYCQPTIYADRYRVGGILGMAGISNGQYIQPQGVNITAASQAANFASTAMVINPKSLIVLPNGWALQSPTTQGNFMEAYGTRYYLALNGYQQEIASEVLYPTYYASRSVSDREMLTSSQAYIITFYGRPPVIKSKGGFWSLTLYTPEKFLIPNPLQRYEIGDRSVGLAYPDGSLVYPNNNGTSEDTVDVAVDPQKVFKVLIQPQDVTPPANWTANWIPSQAGGGELNWILRWYAPSDAFLNGTYLYPKVERVDALRA